MPQKNNESNRGSNYNATNKGTQKAASQRSKPNGNKGIKSISLVATLTGFALVSFLFMFLWWLEEQLDKFHFGYSVPIICFVLFALGIAGISWLLIEIIGWPNWIKPIAIIFCLIFGIYLLFNLKSFSPQETQPSPAPTAIAVPQPDYIEGTEFTHKQLEDFFPFGYAVIYYSEPKRFKYEVFNTGKEDWALDWDKVRVEPDFASGKVTITIVPLSAKGLVQATFINTEVSNTCQLKNGHGGIFPFGSFGMNRANQPVPYMLVLSDNERSPVFAVGFRIYTAGEGIPVQKQ